MFVSNFPISSSSPLARQRLLLSSFPFLPVMHVRDWVYPATIAAFLWSSYGRATICKCVSECSIWSIVRWDSAIDPEQTPDDPGWPSIADWNGLNASVSGKLIADVQPAVVCYPGSAYNAHACNGVIVGLRNQSYISQTAIGLSWPTDSCPAVNVTAGEIAGSCSIGDQPRYSVNATNAAHVAHGVRFARKHGIRLVVRNTGHDLLGRCVTHGGINRA